MIATQHSGEGKANQHFPRGFNPDHGTDFASFIDGVPANLRTHGHGQGYTDLNFLIPELVEKVEHRKGPYFADAGDFSAAGTARFKTCDAPPRNFAEATVGEYGHCRGLAAGSFAPGGGTLLAGAEAAPVDGPWVPDEQLRKYNGLLEHSRQDGERCWNLTLSAYDNQWDSTDQVPLRALRSGLIPRYGYIDPYPGGETSRPALSSQMQSGETAIDLCALHYELSLISNFTYELEDPVSGDEFEQRAVYGGELRHDDIGKVDPCQTIAGRRIDTVREDAVDELSVGAYAELETHPTPDLRADVYDHVDARTQPRNSSSGTDGMISPKLALAWRARRARRAGRAASGAGTPGHARPRKAMAE